MTSPGFVHGHGASASQLPDTLGQLTSAASLSVVLASDYALAVVLTNTTNRGVADASTLRVTVATDDTVAISAASLPLPLNAATEVTLTSINSKLAGTIAVSAASLPLPTGAATETTLAALSAKLPASLGAKVSASSLSVVLASDQAAIAATQSGTWTITGVSGTISLPTGAATGTKQDTGNTSLASIDTKLVQHALDTGASSGAIRTVLSTRQEAATTPLSVRLTDGSAFYDPDRKGRSYADSARNDYTGVNVTTGAWVQLIASTAADINMLYIFDSSGQTLELGTGAAASETRKMIITPGGLPDGVPLRIASGTRVSIRAISATASVGEIDLVGLS